MIERNTNITFFAIIILAVFLIFFRLDRADEQTDGAIFSIGSIGYIDYILSDSQTTPFQWFETPPWWSKLSFHDRPPLTPFIQHIFFKVFGESLFVMRLPYALTGIGSILLLYFIVKSIYNKKIALLSILILTVSTLFSWSSKSAYLEGIEVFFILLTLFLFIQAQKDKKFFIFSGTSLGLTFLTKYTSFFLLPAIFAYMLLKNKKMIFSKQFIVSLIIALGIFSPVIVYNFMMYQERGHLDAQFTYLFKDSMYEAANKDWPSLYYKDMASPSIVDNIQNIFFGLRGMFSKPFFYILIISSIVLLIGIFFIKDIHKHFLIPLVIFFITVEFSFISGEVRFFPIFTPFLAVSASIIIFYFLERLKEKKLYYYFSILILAFIVSFELFYNINTNLLNKPILSAPVFLSEHRKENFGYKQLEQYLVTLFENDPGYARKPRKLQKKSDVSLFKDQMNGRDVFIYDFRLNWFATLWHLQKYELYHRIAITRDRDIVVVSKLYLPDWLPHLKKIRVRNAYYIQGADLKVLTGKFAKDEKALKLSQSVEYFFRKEIDGGGSIKEIYNSNNELAFRIYKVSLNK